MGRILAVLATCVAGFAQDRPAANPEQTLDAFTRAVAEGRLTGTPGAMDILRELKSALPADDYSDARERLLTELVRRGDRVISRYTSGDEVPQQKKDYDDCAGWFEAANELEPSPRSESRMLFCRGRSFLDPASRDLPNAIRSLSDAVEKSKDEAFLYNALGVAYLEQGRITEAADRFRDAIQREPAWTYPRHNLALTFMESGDYATAQQWYREAIAADERNGLTPGYLHYNLGLLAHQLGHKKEAMQEYQAALTLFQAQKNLNRERAVQLERANRPAEAQTAAGRSADFERDEAEAYNAIGALWASQGKLQQASDAYQQALSLNPGLTAAQQNLELLLKRGKFEGLKKPASTATAPGGQTPPRE